MIRAIEWLGLVACTSEAPVASSGSWILALAADPDAFATTVEADRDAWIALHDHRPADAAALTDDPGLDARAALELAGRHRDLAALEAAAWAELARTWRVRPSAPPAEDPFWVLVQAAADCDAATRLGAAPLDEAWVTAHEAARAGEVDALTRRVDLPLLTVQADGFSREYADPCVHDSLARGWSARAEQALGGPIDARLAASWTGPDAPWVGRLFAPWDDGAELATHLADAPWPDAGRVAAPDACPPAPTCSGPAERAAAAADALDQEQSALEQALRGAPEGGRSLVAELDLIERRRGQRLVAASRHAARQGDAALAWELARRAPESPASLAALARAAFASGRSRESLEALAALRSAVPGVPGLAETVGDAVVSATLDRAGDSKED